MEINIVREVNYELIDKLTKREIEVLQGLVDTNGDLQVIADKMVIDLTTVISHKSRLFCKLRVSSKLAAVLEGLKRGLINIPGFSLTPVPLDTESSVTSAALTFFQQ
jgi:DNA-binding NarL/FixJ family response regulator